MKAEEAIKWMEKAIQETERDFDLCSPDLQKELTEQKEVFETAISALRSLVESKDKDVSTLTEQLRRMSVETGSLVCLGCGREHNCGILGCALLRQAVETIEKQATVIDHLPDITKMVPLTLEQLRKMDGKPGYCEDGEYSCWGFISVDSKGKWANIPFFRGRWNEVNFEYDIESRGLKIYPYPLPHIDREAWEPCEWCEGANTINGTAVFSKNSKTIIETVEYTNAVEGKFDFCPHCGRPLTEESWAELEWRLRK